MFGPGDELLCRRQTISLPFVSSPQATFVVTLVTTVASALALFEGIIRMSFCLNNLKDGSLQGWGRNSGGQLGVGHSSTVATPVKIPLKNVVQIQGGYYHVVALCGNFFELITKHETDDGSVHCWGGNSYGELGTGSGHSNETSPVKISPPSAVAAVAAFGFHTFLMLSTKKVN